MADKKEQYVCGFRFNEKFDKVLLIRKSKPEWQRGLLNGIGGKLEDIDNSFIDAIEREYDEETGLGTFDEWREFNVIHNEIFEVHFFVSFGNDIMGFQDRKTDIGEGIIGLYDHPEVLADPTLIPNLTWLIPMSLDEDIRSADVEVR